MEFEETQIGYVLYARKSSEAEERQALSIDSQIKEMLEFAKQQGLQVLEVKQESCSAKQTGKRPVFNQMLTEIRSGKFQGIVTWAPDRLSRNAGDLGSIVDLMDTKLLHSIRTPSQRFTDSPSDKFLLMILCSQAKLENDNKSVNVKRGLRAKCELGFRPGVAPLGYLSEPGGEKGRRKVIVDPVRAPIVKEIFQLVAEHGYSGRDIYAWLRDEAGFRTRGDKLLSLSGVYRMLSLPFYYGQFEYPKGSGKWYEGAHEALITKELYDRVQEHLDIPSRHMHKRHTFSFTKLIRCGACGSFVSAEQKIKTLKTGEQKHYVYYRCSRGRNRSCAELPITEELLTEQLLSIVKDVKLDDEKLTQRLKRELLKYRSFMDEVVGQGFQRPDSSTFDTGAYARYLLQSGSREEKRELLGCLKSKLLLQQRELLLQ